MSNYTKNYTNEVKLLHSQIEKYRFVDTTREYKFAETLYNLSTENNDYDNIAYSLLRKSDDFVTQENFAVAFTFISNAEQISTDNKLEKLLIECYVSFATMYNSLGDLHKTMEFVLKAYKIAKNQQNKYPEAFIINKIGDLFLQNGSYLKATGYFEHALEILSNVSQHDETILNQVSFLYSNLFFACYKLERYDQAIAYHTKRSTFLHKTNTFSNLYYQFEEAYIYYHTNERDKLCKLVSSMIQELSPNSFYIYHTLETLKHFIDILYFTQNNTLLYDGIQKISSTFKEQGNIPTKIFITKTKIKYYHKYDPNNTAVIISEYEKIEHLREILDQQIDTFKCHEMESQIQTAEDKLKHEQTLKEKEMYKTLYNQDSTTGLLNRRGLNEAFKQMNKRKTIPSTIGLIILDIDCFKQYNDNYGHLKGDSAILGLVTALNENSSKHFIPARFGGDEFVCLVENKTDEEIKTFIKLIQKHLAAKKIKHEFSTVDNPYVTVSIGYCNEQFTDSISLEDLIYKSDIALYEAKSAGKNRYFKG
ncbi:MAG: hypothetical protein BKP49_09875 [Treponema sp. CETP13]|nr:MAG: hypothetical protein BKP49_09875 [Treponema sp. CETP13]